MLKALNIRALLPWFLLIGLLLCLLANETHHFRVQLIIGLYLLFCLYMWLNNGLRTCSDAILEQSNWKLNIRVVLGCAALAGATLISTNRDRIEISIIFWLLGVLILICPRRIRIPEVRNVWFFLLVLSISLLLNCLWLDYYPYRIHGDEGEISQIAQRDNLISNIFLPSDWWGFPTMLFVLYKPGFWISDAWWNYRIPGALYGVIANLCFYATLFKLTSKRLESIVFTFLFITTPTILCVYRFGVETMHPLLLTALFTFLVASWLTTPQKREIYSIAIGLVIGFGLLIYPAGRLLIPLWGAFICLVTFLAPDRRSRFAVLFQGVQSLIIAFFLAAPILFWYLNSPSTAIPHQELVDRFVNDFKLNWQSYEWWKEYLYGIWRTVALAYSEETSANGDFFLTDGGFFPYLTAAFVLLAAIPLKTSTQRLMQCVAALSLIVSIGMFALILPVPYQYHRFLAVFYLQGIVGGLAFSKIIQPLNKMLYSIGITGVVLYSGFNVYTFMKLDGPSETRWWGSDVAHLTHEIRDYVEASNGRISFVYFVTWPRFASDYGALKLFKITPISASYDRDEFIAQFPLRDRYGDQLIVIPVDRADLIDFVKSNLKPGESVKEILNSPINNTENPSFKVVYLSSLR